MRFWLIFRLGSFSIWPMVILVLLFVFWMKACVPAQVEDYRNDHPRWDANHPEQVDRH